MFRAEPSFPSRSTGGPSRVRAGEGRGPEGDGAGERRVALVPDTVARLAAAGFDVRRRAGAGAGAGFADDAYAEAGATSSTAASSIAGAECVVRVGRPTADEVARARAGHRS